MIKTIIVDDEILVRVGLKSMVDWQDLGYEIIGEAGDGIQALELCKNGEVDLVITDIKMPKMDGIELIRSLCDQYPSVRIIVLSCYNEGEYIKEAMKYHGALDYIFKIAMDGTELKKTLENVKKIIYEDRARNGPVISQPKIAVDNHEKMKIWDRIFAADGKAIDQEFKTHFNMNLELPYICIAIRLFETEEFAYMKWEEMWKKENQLYFTSSLSSLFGKEKMGYDVSFLMQETIVLVSMERQHGQEAVLELCKKIDSINHFWTNSHMSFGISSTVSGAGRLSRAYGQARAALEDSFFHGEARISFYKEVPKEIGAQKAFPMRYELMILLYNDNFAGIQSAVEDYFWFYREKGRIREEEVKENCFVFLTGLTAALTSRLDYDFLTRYKKNLWEKIMDCRTIDGLQKCVMNYTEGLLAEYDKQERRLLSEETKMALRYMQKNYAQELHLKDMAEHIGMNESYLSHLFKKEYGKSLITYLNEYRILKAQELIVSSNVSLNLVAEAVGYMNYTYFSKVFKSITGVNAIDFKAGIKKV